MKRSHLLLVLLVLLVGAGVWNHERNRAIEEAVVRPYRGYSDIDLEALATAYRQEVDSLGGRYQTLRGQSNRVREAGFLGEKVKEFERVHRHGTTVRELGAKLSEREATLREIDAELRLREADRDRLAVFLRRLFTF